MKKINSLIRMVIVFALLLVTWTTNDVFANNIKSYGFKDVEYGSSFYEYITDLNDMGIIKGYEDNTFRPNNSLTRAQAAKMIVLASGIGIENVSSNFKDVNSSSSSYKFISAAFEADIIKGYEDNTFRPNAPVKRSQIAKMVTLAFDLKKKGNPPKFTDVEKISNADTRNYIYTLSSLGIVKGYNKDFRPYNNVTRGQFSKIAMLSIDSSVNYPTETHKEAVKSAQLYSNIMAMSKIGIYEQLRFEGYSHDVSQFAVNNIVVNWKTNALIKAQDYSDTMHFSKKGLHHQLTSEYGEQFTEEEAEYAVNSIDVDWNINALETAKKYLDMGLSKEAIYNQLVSDYGEQFTSSQGQYAIDNLN